MRCPWWLGILSGFPPISCVEICPLLLACLLHPHLHFWRIETTPSSYSPPRWQQSHLTGLSASTFPDAHHKGLYVAASVLHRGDPLRRGDTTFLLSIAAPDLCVPDPVVLTTNYPVSVSLPLERWPRLDHGEVIALSIG